MVEFQETLESLGDVEDIFAFVEENYDGRKRLGRVIADDLENYFHFGIGLNFFYFYLWFGFVKESKFLL